MINRFLIGVALFATVAASLYFYLNSTPLNIGADLPDAPALFETSLAAPITASADSFTLTSNSVRGGGTLSGYQCFTIDEGSAQAEFVCGTASGTAVTNVTRGISPSDGTSQVADLMFAHRRGASVKITDFPVIQIIRNQNSGEATFENALRYAASVVPSSADDLADVGYVLSMVNGGTVNFDALTVSGTAGETVATNTLVYFKSSDQRWWKVDTDATSTFQDVPVGLTRGAGSAAGTIAGGGVLLKGLQTGLTGLTAGGTYYASSSAGDFNTATSVMPIGVAKSITELQFDPVMLGVARLAFNNTFTGVNTFNGSTTFSRPVTFSGNVAFTASTSFTGGVLPRISGTFTTGTDAGSTTVTTNFLPAQITLSCKYAANTGVSVMDSVWSNGTLSSVFASYDEATFGGAGATSTVETSSTANFKFTISSVTSTSFTIQWFETGTAAAVPCLYSAF